jgi:hypothetical protein
MNHKNMDAHGTAEKPVGRCHVMKQGICLTIIKISLLSLLLSINPWGLGISQATDTLERKGAGKPMKMSQMKSSTAMRIPTIDVAAPKRFETATFAMG